MSTPKPTVLESLQLAEQLLKEIKQHQTTNQQRFSHLKIQHELLVPKFYQHY